jgi:hypothetical protein
MLNLKTTFFPLAELLAKAKQAGEVVRVEKPVPALTAVPVKPVTSGLLTNDVQLDEPLEPSR